MDKITSVYYLGDGVVIVNKLVRTTDNHDVADCARQVLTTCVVYVEVQRPQNTRLALLTRCTQITVSLSANINREHHTDTVHRRALFHTQVTKDLVGWSLTSRFSTNMAILKTKGQVWRAIPTQYR